MAANRQALPLFIRNAASTLGRQVASVGIGLLFVIIIARLFGPEGSGQYNLAILLPTMLATILNFGIAPANVFYIARGSISLRSAIAVNFRLWLALSLVGVLLATVVLRYFSEALFPGVPKPFIALGLISFPLLLSQQFLGSLLQARQAFSLFNKTLLVTPIATLIAVLVMVPILNLGITGALLSFLVGQLLGTLALLHALLQIELPRDAAAADNEAIRVLAKKLLGYGWKAHLSNVLTFINYRADIFLVNLFLTPASAGLYVIAVQLAERLWILSAAASTVLLPRLSELHEDPEQKHKLTSLVSLSVLLLSFLAAVALAALATPLITLLFGVDYLPARQALLYLLPGVLLGSSARILSNDLAARGKPELNMYTAVLVVLINVAGNLILIPRMGIAGAALSTSFAYATNFLAKIVLYSIFTRRPWWSTLWPSTTTFQALSKIRRHK